ncbi:T9SS type A sorting domain-containing protein [Hyunsoonleella sp. SJ7]|uniref:T9SS type A sorting domain-containing protein n=1 Tax=Hyunsoonleella aquatilis TaxID=2762758 RepID=A0A923H703_9FLAO|nr:T9SS type A sorting domain-containing protein [Hyunsoonleella aquatilis]MBC3757606.1 T9SS type A sorting domain-containing protein [Hyunsoonleella aquatilis]
MRNTITLAILLFCTAVNAQSIDYQKAPTTPGSNYYDVVNAMRSSIASKKNIGKNTKADIKAEKQFERWAYFWKDRVDIDGSFPSTLQGYYNAGILDMNGRLRAKEASKHIMAKSSSGELWTNVGPQTVPDPNGYPNFPQMGRLTSFLRYKHATDASQNVLFISAPNGGIWKSNDNGATWTPKLDHIAGIGVTDIRSSSTDINNPGTIYVSTGDYDGAHIKSIGVLKSTNFGETYQSTGLSFSLEDQESTSNLIVIDANTVIVGTNKFIKKTTDGGATWTNVYTHTYNDAQLGKFHRNGNNIICCDSWGGLFFSSNNGNSWSALINEGVSSARHASTSDVNGVFYVQNKAGQVSTYNPSAMTPTLTALGNPTTNYNPQGTYNQALTVKDGLIISGGVDGINTEDNGSVWYTTLNNAWQDNTSPGSYAHADIHEMGVLDSGYSFWACNDGGLIYFTYANKSDEKPVVEYKSDGVLITQLYSVAISPQSENHKIMGNQDNDGYSLEMKDGSLKWVSALAGDGTCTAIDYTNPNIRYLGGQNGSLIRTDTGFANNYDGDVDITTPAGAPFVWTLKMNTTTSTTLYGGFGELYKSTNKGDTWSNLNSGAGQIEFIETFGNNLFVVGQNGARKSTNDGSSWASIIEPEASAKINSLSFNQTNANIVYATVTGYINGSKVFKSTDGGSTWTNISSGLPNILAKQVLLKQNQGQEILFLGTELGVYFKIGTEPWTKLGIGLPNVIINDIEINYTVDKLIVATYGRGLWEISINNATLGVEEQKLADSDAPKLFPNPVANGILNIQSKHEMDYVIYNVLGGLVVNGQIKIGHNTIDTSKIASGVYVIRMTKGNLTSTSRFINR